jgi:hypothetical protein
MKGLLCVLILLHHRRSLPSIQRQQRSHQNRITELQRDTVAEPSRAKKKAPSIEITDALFEQLPRNYSPIWV